MKKEKKGFVNNEGFSLVELVIVIAIMAVLASAIGISLLRYLERSRTANCASARDTIEKEYYTDKVEIENFRLDNDLPDPEYDIQEFLDEHAGEDKFKCPDGGTFQPDASGEHIECTKHGSNFN